MSVAAFVRQLVADLAFHLNIIRAWAPRLGAPRCAMWNVFITTTQGREKWWDGPIRGLLRGVKGQWASWKPSKCYEAIICGFVALRWREMECYHNYSHRAARPIEDNLHKARDVTEESSDNYGHNHANVSTGTIVKWFKLTSTQREYKYEDVLTNSLITWVSDKCSVLASSFLSWPTTYWLFSKACSSLSSWEGEKAVRIRLGFLKGNRNSGRPGGPETEYTVSD